MIGDDLVTYRYLIQKIFGKRSNLLITVTPPPTNIERIEGCEKMSELWKNNYKELFNCVRINISDVKYNILVKT